MMQTWPSHLFRPVSTRALTALLLAFGVAAGCGGGRHEDAATPGNPVDVTTARVVTRRVQDGSDAGGVLQARQTATLTSRILAPVRTVTVQPGDEIRAGQVLVTLDVRDLSANARLADSAAQAAEHGARAATSESEAADAALALSQASYDRIANLAERKSATPQELDEATAALRASRARVSASKARIAEADAVIARSRAASDSAIVSASYGTIAAPFAGRVTEKLVDPGNMAAPGVPLLRVESTDGFRVHVRLDESRVASIVPGQEMDVTIGDTASAGNVVAMAGTVAEIARAIEADARAFLVKIDLPASPESKPALRSGMFARVRVPGAAREATVVPARAVIQRGQVATVFVVEKDVARLRIIQTGTRQGDDVEVLAGLDADERVAIAPPESLRDGSPVRVSDTARKDPR